MWRPCDWLGTSLGGLIGMTLAALPDSPVTKLVLNDVGPVLAAASLARIGAYVGKWPPLPTIEAAEAYVRTVNAPFGPHSDCRVAIPDRTRRPKKSRRLPAHALRPALAVAFTAQPLDRDMELWSFYDSIRCPTLVLRGEHSDLLTRETAQEMSERGPRQKSWRSRTSGMHRR